MGYSSKIKRAKDLLGLNEIMDQLATANSVHRHGHGYREDNHT